MELQREMDKEKKLRHSWGHMLAQIWKTVKLIFKCTIPKKPFSELEREREDMQEFLISQNYTSPKKYKRSLSNI